MAFAMVGGVVVLLGLGLAVAVKMVIDARKDLEDLEDEIADARGLGLNLARDPEPESWSAGDFELLRDDEYDQNTDDPYATLTPPEGLEVLPEDDARMAEVVEEDASEPYAAPHTAPYAASTQESSLESWEILRDDADDEEAPERWEIVADNGDEEDVHAPTATMTPGNAAERWQVSLRPNGSEVQPRAEQPTTDVQPFAWHAQSDPPVVILVVGVGFLGAGGSAVTAASRLHMPRHEFDLSAQAGRDAHTSASVPPLSSFYDANASRDDLAEAEGRGNTSSERGRERRTGNGHPTHNGSAPDRIAWRPPA